MQKDKIILISLIIPFCIAIFWFIFSSDLKGVVPAESKPISHQLFTEVLTRFVRGEGRFNYEGLLSDREKLDEYLTLLSAHHPNDTYWSEAEQKAYWINAYNAFTIRLILNNYPVESIKDLGGFIYRVNTPWDIEFIMIEGQKYDLNDIEHNILRANYNDPRIHFALNCASMSCPVLPKEAYDPSRLNSQLDAAGRRFLKDETKNKISKNTIEISRVFKWFTSDFTNEGTVIDFLNKYSDIKIDEDADIDYLEYDWRLNDYKKE